MKLRTFLLGSALAVGMAYPAAASHGPTGADFTPNLRTERVYFHCQGTGKVHNTVTDDSVPWNTTAPTSSFTTGSGCASHDNPLQGNNQVSVQDSHFGGSYTANLNTLTVELHNIYVGPARASGPLTFNVRLLVDDIAVLGAGGTDVTVQPVRSSTGASEMVKFSVKGINLLTEETDTEHTILMTLSGGKLAASTPAFPVRDTLSGWVYDATEVPAGITFNPTTLAPVSVSRVA